MFLPITIFSMRLSTVSTSIFSRLDVFAVIGHLSGKMKNKKRGCLKSHLVAAKRQREGSRR